MSPTTTLPHLPHRQLVIGLDAGEWELIRRYVAAGELPVFRRLLEEGAHASLQSTAEQLPDTVWWCIYSGRNPAAFDKHFYVQYDPRTRDLRHVGDDAATNPPFWQALSDAGRRVGVVDAVKIACSPQLNGFQLANWGAHATKALRESLPPELFADVERRIGVHPVGDCDRIDDDAASRGDLLRRILAGVRMRGALNRQLMQEREWDVFFTAFSEPHCVGHHFWHGADPMHPRHTEIAREGHADAIRQVYVAIDQEIGRMLELVDDRTLCLVVSGHGMGPVYHASWNLQQMLDLWGFGPRPARRARCAKGKQSPWRLLKRLLPGKLQYAIKNALPTRLQDELLFRWYAGNRDWDGWRAFAVPNNDSVGAIRLSVQGRDRGGLVKPEDYAGVCDDLTARLAELVDAVTGRPVVAKITRLHEVFRGEFRDQLPDLTVLWDQSFPWHTIESPRFGTLEIRSQDARTGTHTPSGFVIAAGPGVPRGQALGPQSIYDIAPTIYAAAGVAIPEGVEGRPLAILGEAAAA